MIRFRAQPLIAAAWFALAFVALRVVYRGLFNGLNRGGQQHEGQAQRKARNQPHNFCLRNAVMSLAAIMLASASPRP